MSRTGIRPRFAAVTVAHEGKEYAVAHTTETGLGELRGTRARDFMKAVAHKITQENPKGAIIEVHFGAEPGVRLPGNVVRDGQILKREPAHA